MAESGTPQYDAWTREQLIEAVEEYRHQVAALQNANEEYRWVEEALKKRTRELNERVKEIDILYGIATLLKRAELAYDDLLQAIADRLPGAWQQPEFIGARITMDDKEYRSSNFAETFFGQVCPIFRNRKPVGNVQVCFVKPPPAGNSFLKEEQWLLNAVASWLGEIGERRSATGVENRQPAGGAR